MRQTDQAALRRILLQQSAADFRAFLLPSREALTKHQALGLLDSSHYVFKTDRSGSRVRWMQAIETAPEMPGIPARIARWMRCYRTCEAPVLGPSAEYAR